MKKNKSRSKRQAWKRLRLALTPRRAAAGCRSKEYVKVSVGVLSGSMIRVGSVVLREPFNDKSDALESLRKTSATDRPLAVYAEADYHADWVHRFCRDLWGSESCIPPVIHRNDGTANGKYRRQNDFDVARAK